MLNFKNINIVTVGLFLTIIFLNVQFQISFWYLILPLIFWIGLTSLGSFNFELNYFLKAKHHNHSTDKNNIALTFDDGPHPEFTPKVLDLLKSANAKASFFLIGKNAESYPELVKQIIAEGHVIGSHSYAHTNNYGFLSRNKVTKDIMKSQKVLFDITKKNVQFFRSPFGVTNPNIARAVKNLSLKTFGWSVRSYDTVAKNSEGVFKKISTNLKKGDIVLLHDTSELTVEILEKLLEHLKTKNMNSVTLSTLFIIDSYEA
ncbi:MAG: polysaccharide deacetylase family protein [Urechidicola sp.]|nr:polysaccharide deacetylase family protein [Urechidicola sp.]